MWETGRSQFCSFALCLSLGVAVVACDGAGTVVPVEQEPEAGSATEPSEEEVPAEEEASDGEVPAEEEASDGDAPAEEEASDGDAPAEDSEKTSRPPPGSEHQPITPAGRVSRRAIKVTVVEGTTKTVKLICDGRDLGTKPLGKTRTTLFNAATGSCHFVFDGKEPARSGRVQSGTHVKCVVKGAVARCK